jgi:Nif-specific regulatory protein
VSDPQTDRYALLLDLSRVFSEQLDLDELLPLVLTRIKEVLRAEGASILLLEEGGATLCFPATSRDPSGLQDRLATVRFPIAGWVLREGRSVRVPDVTRDERFYAEVDKQTGMHTRDLLCAPLRTREGVVGAVEVINRLDGSFSEEDLEFLDSLAGVIAIAIENARLYRKVVSSESQLKQEVAVLHRERIHRERFDEILGGSPAMERVFSLMRNAVPSTISVLLEGETGVGKELIARAVHYNGPRKSAPFVTVNCGSLPETLLESELFGFRRGAFTGAVGDKQGLFEAADGGTLFLDEIGETSPAMQVKLLRALEEGEIRRVGETRVRKVDVRLISATNRDLAQEAREGRFREDLYYRISVFPIRVPPLRERREDIPLLASHFLDESCRRLRKTVSEIDPAALKLLAQYPWPGNVRELENEIERAVALAREGDALSLDCLSDRILSPSTLSIAVPSDAGSLKAARLEFEREYIREVLRDHGGNATQAARILGISRQMLQRKIKEYGLRAPE